jgi:ribonuclease Z
MLPKPPPREGPLGFLYLPPFRVQGVSVAGETTVVQVPELDVCFDMGECPRPTLASKWLAISHGHMDHVGTLAYWCSQRNFQGMGPGKIVCDARIERAVRRMMDGFVELEQQTTPFEVFPLAPEGEITIKPNTILRGFETEHTCPSFGYVVIEKRSKLKAEYVDQPQERLRELKAQGVEITRMLDIPLVAYLGDTAPGPCLIRQDVRTAQIVVCECTFVEPDHKSRAKIGKHLHLDDVVEWLGVLEAQHVVLTHVSRRSNLAFARKQLVEKAGRDRAERVHFLMDHRANRARYERQEAEAAAREAQRIAAGGAGG